MRILFGLILNFLLPLLTLGMERLNRQDQTNNKENTRSLNYLDRSAPESFYSYFLAHYDEDNEDLPLTILEKRSEDEAWEDEPEDLSHLNDLLAGGPLENRRFVAIEVLPRSGKKVELTFRFDAGLSREKRDEKKNKPSDLINQTVKDEIKKPPPGFNTSTVLVRYGHQLTAVEKAGDSQARLGSPCQQTSILEPDYCERAAYPNKNKMVCNRVNDTELPSLLPNTCICKFYRVNETAHAWKQMKSGAVTVNGEELETCLVPKNGVCNHRAFSGYLDAYGRPIYEVDVCLGHYQCDNTEFYPALKNGNNSLEFRKHCKPDDFLNEFEERVHSQVLMCAKPKPSRFSNYDEFKFYCLPKKLRDEEYKPSDSVDGSTQDYL